MSVNWIALLFALAAVVIGCIAWVLDVLAARLPLARREDGSGPCTAPVRRGTRRPPTRPASSSPRSAP